MSHKTQVLLGVKQIPFKKRKTQTTSIKNTNYELIINNIILNHSSYSYNDEQPLDISKATKFINDVLINGFISMAEISSLFYALKCVAHEFYCNFTNLHVFISLKYLEQYVIASQKRIQKEELYEFVFVVVAIVLKFWEVDIYDFDQDYYCYSFKMLPKEFNRMQIAFLRQIQYSLYLTIESINNWRKVNKI